MATLYANDTSLNVDLKDRINGAKVTGRVNIVHKTYTFLGTEAQGDVIRLFRSNAGMKIIPHLSLITSDGVATTATVDVGDDDTAGVGAAADPDRYCDGANVAAAGIDLFTAPANAAAATTPYVIGADGWITATLATLVTPVADKKLEFLIVVIGA